MPTRIHGNLLLDQPRQARWFVVPASMLSNHKRLRRIYAEERLQVRRRGGRKSALGTRAPLLMPSGPNQGWSLDFVSNAPTDGRRLRILCIIDDDTGECLCPTADTALSGRRVAQELDLLIAQRGRSHTVVRDNGTERWISREHRAPPFAQPG